MLKEKRLKLTKEIFYIDRTINIWNAFDEQTVWYAQTVWSFQRTFSILVSESWKVHIQVCCGCHEQAPAASINFTVAWSFPRGTKHLGHQWSAWASSAAAASTEGPSKPVPDKYAFQAHNKQANSWTSPSRKAPSFAAGLTYNDCLMTPEIKAFSWWGFLAWWVTWWVFLSASLYVSKRGAYWDRLYRDVVGRWLVGRWLVGRWSSRACTVAKRCILGL